MSRLTAEQLDGPFYLDASAAIKLVLDEPESRALQEYVGRPGGKASSSELLIAELTRALRRRAAAAGIPEQRLLEAAGDLLKGMHLVTLDREVVIAAGRLDPALLRTLDAVHVVSAVKIGGVSSFVSYDRRQLHAARTAGLQTASPGAV